MPTILTSLFSAKVLLQIFDSIFDFDVFDLRTKGEQFSFFSPAGLVVLFAAIFATGHAIESHVALNCSLSQLMSLSGDCQATWLAVGRLTLVLAIAYAVAILLGRWFVVLRPASAVLEHVGSLFVAACVVLTVFHLNLWNGRSTFAWISDQAMNRLGTEGTSNNAIAVAAASGLTIVLATCIALIRRYWAFEHVSWKGWGAYLLAAHYLVFTTVALSLSFYVFQQ